MPGISFASANKAQTGLKAEHSSQHSSPVKKPEKTKAKVKAKANVSNSVNINTAEAKTLATLKRIGTKKAEEIVQYRKQHGKFKSIQDLAKVKGISQTIIEANQQQLRLG